MGSVIIKLKSCLDNTKENDTTAIDYYTYYMFDELANITCPTLLITSENIHRYPENSIAIQNVKKSASLFEHSIITNVGHFIPQEKPNEFNELVFNFFNKI